MPRAYSVKERIVSGLCYLPSLIGFIIGVVYIIAKGEGSEGRFFRFHFYQSIFLSILGFGIMAVASGSSDIVIGFVRLFEGMIGPDIPNAISGNVALASSVLVAPIALAGIYAMIWAFLGKFTRLPMVTGMIDNMLR